MSKIIAYCYQLMWSVSLCLPSDLVKGICFLSFQVQRFPSLADRGRVRAAAAPGRAGVHDLRHPEPTDDGAGRGLRRSQKRIRWGSYNSCYNFYNVKIATYAVHLLFNNDYMYCTRNNIAHKLAAITVMILFSNIGRGGMGSEGKGYWPGGRVNLTSSFF